MTHPFLRHSKSRYDASTPTQLTCLPRCATACAQHLASAADKSEERTSHSKAPPATQYKEWTGEEIDGCKQLTYEGNDVTDFVGLLLTGLFAKHQTAAARKVNLGCGISLALSFLPNVTAHAIR